MKTIILIPVRMASKRFPNKPMALINGKPMVQRVWEQAILSNLGEVVVACCEKEVFDHIKALGGKAEMTNPDLPSGTDRIYEAIKNYSNIDQIDSIINLQGDMPIINPKDIGKVNIPLQQGFDIGTLVTEFTEDHIKDVNITKAKIAWIHQYKIGKAIDFFKKDLNFNINNTFHHVGIYSFRYDALRKFVSMSPSKNEINRKLEQLRALDAKMTIGVSYVKNIPISVDTKKDLIKVEKIIKDL